MSEGLGQFEAVDSDEIYSLREKLLEKIGEALSLQEFEKIKSLQDQLTKDFLDGNLTGAELTAKMEPLIHFPGTIHTRLLAMYAVMLRALRIDEQEVQEILAHENEHAVAAIREGFNVLYRLEFAKDESGKLAAIQPSIILDEEPNGITEEQRREAQKRITSAPDELSDSDNFVLGT